MSSPPPRHSPLRANDDPGQATRKQLREQMRFELAQVKLEREHTNEELAHALGYLGGGSVSKWLNGRDALPRKAAQALDKLGCTTSIGLSFEELQKAYRNAARSSGRRATRAPEIYDVFLASPMASLSSQKAYETERRAARDLKEVLENYYEFSVYYAGGSFESKEEFDLPLAAAERNFDALRNSRYFILLSVSDATRPSSVTVEAGYALGNKISSIYLVRNTKHLPFVLRALGPHESPDLPPVYVETVDSNRRAVTLIRKHGSEIFKRLDEQAEPSTPRRSARRKGKGR